MIPLIKTLVGDEEVAAASRVIRSGQLASGPEVAAFEAEFASAIGVRYAIAVNSGTAAIHCALEALGVGEGDEVLTTPFTFAATATPILMQRATPRFVDIDPRTFNVGLNAFLENTSERTKAVVAVDLFGLPVDASAKETLRAKGIALVEDACQAIGAERDGVRAGSLLDVGCFSLYATKNLMTGEGGMVTTDNDTIAAAARRFRQHGQGERYEYLSLGYNYRMTDIAAAIGRVQLGRLDSVQSKRRANAEMYNAALADVPGVFIPNVPPNVTHAYHQYTILVDSQHTKTGITRDDLRRRLNEQGIGSGVYYPTPLHLNPLFSHLGFSKGDFPVAEMIATQVLSLPIHPLLTAADVQQVAEAIRSHCGV